MTNYDRMTTEEKLSLAEELAECGFCPYFKNASDLCNISEDCDSCIVAWLNEEEVKDDCESCKIEGGWANDVCGSCIKKIPDNRKRSTLRRGLSVRIWL